MAKGCNACLWVVWWVVPVQLGQVTEGISWLVDLFLTHLSRLVGAWLPKSWSSLLVCWACSFGRILFCLSSFNKSCWVGTFLCLGRMGSCSAQDSAICPTNHGYVRRPRPRKGTLGFKSYLGFLVSFGSPLQSCHFSLILIKYFRGLGDYFSRRGEMVTLTGH